MPSTELATSASWPAARSSVAAPTASSRPGKSPTAVGPDPVMLAASAPASRTFRRH